MSSEAVKAGHEVDPEPLQELISVYNVLEHSVVHASYMRLSVGEGRTVVENPCLGVAASLKLKVVKVLCNEFCIIGF